MKPARHRAFAVHTVFAAHAWRLLVFVAWLFSISAVAAQPTSPGEERVDAVERLWHPEHSQLPLLPPDRLQVVFAAEPVDVFGRRGLAEAVYFESPAGAKVFSSGTNRWTWGLGKEGLVQEPFQRFNQNLVLGLLARTVPQAS